MSLNEDYFDPLERRTRDKDRNNAFEHNQPVSPPPKAGHSYPFRSTASNLTSAPFCFDSGDVNASPSKLNEFEAASKYHHRSQFIPQSKHWSDIFTQTSGKSGYSFGGGHAKLPTNSTTGLKVKQSTDIGNSVGGGDTKLPTNSTILLRVKQSTDIDITNKDLKIVIPEDLLEELHCSICKKYLSKLPVYIYPDEQKFICGRCPIERTRNPIQITIYESIVKFLVYPCCYKSNGCVEQFPPNEISAHEESCPYTQFACFSYPQDLCRWLGYKVELHAHFEDEHKDLILNDCDCNFQFNLTEDHKNNYLMMKNGEMFLIHAECDSEQFYGSVNCFVKKENTQYEYEFFFRESDYSIKLNEKKDVQYSLNMNLDKNSAVCFDVSKINLTNPYSAVCFVNIVPKTQNVTELCTTDSNEKLNDLEDTLLSEIECPCCIEPMSAPIFQCPKGHSICNICVKLNQKCPSCSKSLKDVIRNFGLEKMAKHLSKYPCKYTQYGCSFISTPECKPIHEKSCPYLEYFCPLDADKSCNWKGTLQSILEHVQLQHVEDIIDLSTRTFIFSDNVGKNEDCLIYNCNGDLFRLMFKYHEKQLFWSVQFIGPSNNSVKFMYILDFIDTQSNERCFIKRKCAPLTRYVDAFVGEETFLCVPIKFLKGFVDEGCITYKISIVTC